MCKYHHLEANFIEKIGTGCVSSSMSEHPIDHKIFISKLTNPFPSFLVLIGDAKREDGQ